jgi:hypothetical protein
VNDPLKILSGAFAWNVFSEITLDQRGGEKSKEFVRMKKSPKLAMATAIALGLAASVALAQKPGFGGHGAV